MTNLRQKLNKQIHPIHFNWYLLGSFIVYLLGVTVATNITDTKFIDEVTIGVTIVYLIFVGIGYNKDDAAQLLKANLFVISSGLAIGGVVMAFILYMIHIGVE